MVQCGSGITPFTHFKLQKTLCFQDGGTKTIKKQ